MEENKNIEPEQPAENIPEEIISSEETTVTETEEQQIEQSEIPMTIGATIPIAIRTKQQTHEEMEVHHHTHKPLIFLSIYPFTGYQGHRYPYGHFGLASRQSWGVIPYSCLNTLAK